jgi:hypothetical protein
MQIPLTFSKHLSVTAIVNSHAAIIIEDGLWYSLFRGFGLLCLRLDMMTGVRPSDGGSGGVRRVRTRVSSACHSHSRSAGTDKTTIRNCECLSAACYCSFFSLSLSLSACVLSAPEINRK